jgi:hypothetical protein
MHFRDYKVAHQTLKYLTKYCNVNSLLDLSKESNRLDTKSAELRNHRDHGKFMIKEIHQRKVSSTDLPIF